MDRLEVPLRWRKPRRVFVNSMSDLFHPNVPRTFLDAVWSTMIEARQHQFQILTKRPARMLEFMTARAAEGWRADRENIWLGVSIEDQATADERIPLLLDTPAAVRFLSAEPLLGPVDLASIDTGDSTIYPLWPFVDVEGRGRASAERIDWVIAGGESGPNARPSHPDWFCSLRDQCARAGVPFFFKQWGEWAPSSIARKRGRPELTDAYIKGDGTIHTTAHGDHQRYDASDVLMAKVGRRDAGRLLAGREHNEYPTRVAVRQIREMVK